MGVLPEADFNRYFIHVKNGVIYQFIPCQWPIVLSKIVCRMMSADDNHVTTQGYKSQLRGYLILGDERKQSADRLKSINVHEPSAVMK